MFAVPTVDQVPTGWTPTTVDAGWAWDLTPPQVDELVAAAAPVDVDDDEQVARLHVQPIRLPHLQPAIDRLRDNLLTGRGFELIRGLPVEDLGDDRSSAAMLVLSSRLGPLRRQNKSGDLVGHVRNTGVSATDPNVRLYQTNERQTFHTDSTDAVGLLALSTAAEGGESLVVSAAAVYHEVARRRPDLVAELFAPVATDRRGEVPSGADPWFTIPVLTWFADQLTVIYQRQYINSSDRFADAPRLRPTQIEALDLFDEVCNDPAMHLRMTLEVGDMQFVHNHTVLHDRTGFRDDPDRPRHLVRTWLSVPEDRPLHPIFAQRYGSITPGDRGGITI